jgi:hypothetical protein
MIIFIFVAGRGDDFPRRVYLRRKYFVYKKLLADCNISDDRHNVIGKMLAEEEAKLLNLFNPRQSPSVQPETPV